MPRELLQQVRLVDPVSRTDQVADVSLANGRILTIAENLPIDPEDTCVQNCRGLILGPGLADLYSQTGEPGFEDRETIASFSAAAIAGGFTRLHLLPNTHPAIDHPATVDLLQTRLRQLYLANPRSPLPSFHLWGALTLGAQGEQMTELAELATAKVIGFTDGRPLQHTGLLRRILEYVAPLNQPIALWPCDARLAGTGVAREGGISMQLGLPGVPAIAETMALAALLELVATTRVPVHLMRISTARSVELIQQAKERGLPITASTTWLHVLLTSENLATYNPNLRLDPPLGNPIDRHALRTGLKTGVLDAIAIDHHPYTYEEKTVAFGEAPPGAIGLELALPLLWQALVATGEWSALELWQCISTNPAHCLKQVPASVTPNQPTELVLFDPAQIWTVNGQTLHSRSSNTHYLDQAITGRVLQTWCPPANA
jgi:dihydroorotase